MYNIGDLIIYGSEGVCQVQKIGKPDNPGANQDRLYYTLIPLYRSGRILIPADSCAFMRPVITRSEAELLIETIPSVHAEIFNDHNLKNLTDHYKDSIKSCDCIDMVRTIKAILMKRQEVAARGKQLGAIDERFLRHTESILYGELAAVLGKTVDEVRILVSEKLRCSEEMTT